MNDSLLDHFHTQWLFVRKLTLDLLEDLPEADLNRSPAATLGSWWKQFRHVGRVQENYIHAIKSGSIKFGIEGTTYSGGMSKRNLQDYLARLDKEMDLLLRKDTKIIQINWFGESKSLAQHLLCLADHEVLHHGQWMVYLEQMGGAFPKSWSAWGV